MLPGEPFELRLVYDTGRFDEPTVECLLVHLVRLLEEISQDPQRRLEELSLLLPGEREQVLSVLATTPDVYEDGWQGQTRLIVMRNSNRSFRCLDLGTYNSLPLFCPGKARANRDTLAERDTW